MTIITLTLTTDTMLLELEHLADEWQLQHIQREEMLIQLLPAYPLGIHGIACERADQEWSFSRDEDATSWEDFLLMHITHRIADTYGLLLHYQFAKHGKYVESTFQHFSTFDHYANYVVRNDQGIVRDIKRKWLYDHQKRFMR
jgi:hypothetical protein